jgi:hypothetical protein
MERRVPHGTIGTDSGRNPSDDFVRESFAGRARDSVRGDCTDGAAASISGAAGRFKKPTLKSRRAICCHSDARPGERLATATHDPAFLVEPEFDVVETVDNAQALVEQPSGEKW